MRRNTLLDERHLVRKSPNSKVYHSGLRRWQWKRGLLIISSEAALAADEGDQAAAGYSLRALHRAHRSLRYVTDSAVQMLGGHGFVQDFPVEKWMRGAQAQVSLL
ncbi:hypothetical protein F3157_14160 [Virgibacillus dakarensis]|nr:hypothetical protein [Virgibacillus dakarensis]